ncbi:AmmeMemoRadiSam system radical SAM enzyme [Candidatus Woesearchaeota archaeon]|nr:AmmeMemoRadiSam system radical SAM enzyme [Candidatus Woesearchaeota archaeon]
MEKETMYCRKLKEGAVQCLLCPHECIVQPDARGACGVRANRAGTLFSLVFGRPCAINVDPIEKKPLFHFLPGESTLSIATVGCNFSCSFCQNWQISKEFGPFDNIFEEYPEVSPERVVSLCRQNASKIISYTYTEPTIFYEYMIETARLAREAGLKNVIVSNGFINEAPLRELCKVLDAANIDLKAFDDKFYRKNCKGRLAPVLKALKILKEEGVWLEVTNLIVPGENDGLEEIEKMCEWISKELGRGVPLHFSRAHPDYKMEGFEPTPLKTLEEAKKIAEKHLDFVYLGNVHSDSGASTKCPECRRILVERSMMSVKKNMIRDGKCPECGETISGVWK